jgi:putative ATP-dependent endonuclease of the OLD family
MKLKKVRIRNFRCFRDETSIDFENITALIGKNDSGKSTIMEALDIFLNDKNPDKDDACKYGDPKDLTIICEFEEIPTEVIIDDTNPTNLKDEFLLNPDGILEIHKTFSGHNQSPKCTNISAYALHPTNEGLIDILQLKNPDLKKRAKELNVDLKDINIKANAPIRSAIRSNFPKIDLKPILVPLNEDNAKSVWDGLKNYMPAFALFKSDRASTDQDPEAQDPLNAAIKEAIKAKEEDLKKITAYVEEEVTKIAKATKEKIREMDPELASELKPEFKPQKWETLFKASITGDEGIPINKRGSGVKRLILLNFFRAKADQQLKESGKNYIIYSIEEPETSQHPNNQRMLMAAFNELSTNSQVILSTHTPMLARCLPDNYLRYIQINKDKSRKILVGGQETNKLFTKSLGVLPDNSVKIFIGIEGPNDIAFLKNISKILINDGVNVLDLEKLEIDGEIIFFPLGGRNLALWTSRLENLNRPEFHLYDRDTIPPAQPKYQTEIDEINLRENCVAVATDKRELENYIHKDAIIQTYDKNGLHITIPNNFSDFDDVPLEVARIIHTTTGQKTWNELKEDVKDEKIKNAKRTLNNWATQYMTKKMLDEIDTKGEVINWFERIRQLL